MTRVPQVIGAFISLASVFGAAFADTATSRAPLCDISQVRSRPIDSLEAGFRSAFCKVAKSKSCSKRWSNSKTFLDLAVADARVVDVGTIAYMFGTIYAETENLNFSPSATEVIYDSNRNKDYVKEGFYGRGWIQLTFKDKYARAGKALGIDLVNHPELALSPGNSYEILYRGMTEGWIEVYRASIDGAVDRAVPIMLSDFVSLQGVDYDLARAVINANCKKIHGKCSPPDVEVRPGLYLPPPTSLDVGAKAAMAATTMEKLLCGTAP